MCGIFAIVKNGKIKLLPKYYDGFQKIKNRGPDDEFYGLVDDNCLFGFHRLSIMDISEKGNQPFFVETTRKKIVTICNGEIYNFQKLIDEFKLPVKSHSDCEVLGYLFERFGIEKMISLLEGVFSIAVFSLDKETGEKMCFFVNDRIGVRPLFVAQGDGEYGFCSEMKGLAGIFADGTIQRFQPGTFMKWNFKDDPEHVVYYNYEYPRVFDQGLSAVYENIRSIFYEAVRKRIHADRPVCALLSGGLDSSIVAAVACDILRKEKPNARLKTFTIGLKGGTDIEYAEQVAKHIGSDHQTVIVSEMDFLSCIPDVIWAIESYDTTTVRASVGQYSMGKYISQDTEQKVILCGDGSDEVLGGYIYFLQLSRAIKEIDGMTTISEDIKSEMKKSVRELFHKECVRLVKDIHLFDGLRADRAISYHGLELRIPFLDQDFVNYMLSIDPEIRMPKHGEMEKILFRRAFENTNLLPRDVLFRRKEAFSDGVSSKENSWFQILQEHIEQSVPDQEFQGCKFEINPPMLKESYHYRKLFHHYFGSNEGVIPYFWLPKFSGNVHEPSARVLRDYHEKDDV